jgi:glycosyltransferase involved in cell wall biosynthesis
MALEIDIVGQDWASVHGGVEFHADTLAAALALDGHIVRRLPYSSRAVRTSRPAGRWMIFEGIRRFVLLADRMNRQSAIRRAIFTHGSFYEFAHQSELQALGYTFDFPTRWARRVFDRTLTEDFLSGFEFLFTLSPAETADIRRLFPGLRGQIVDLPNFAPTSRNGAHLSNQPAGPQHSRTRPYVCAVSRVERRKNFEPAIRAASELGLLFVLAGQDHGDLHRLLRINEDLGTDSFEYIGPVDEASKRTLILGSLGTILPSYFEGVPFGVLDSLSLGKPVVCTNRMYMQPRPGMLLCDPTPSGVRSALSRLLVDPPTVQYAALGTVEETAELLEGYLTQPGLSQG